MNKNSYQLGRRTAFEEVIRLLESDSILMHEVKDIIREKITATSLNADFNILKYLDSTTKKDGREL